MHLANGKNRGNRHGLRRRGRRRFLRLLWTCALLISSCLSVELDDADHDGYSPAEGDCDDTQSQVHPGEGCDAELGGEQNDVTPQSLDQDADGFSPADGDCDDSDANTYPGAIEVEDGVDNNCDGQIDEDEALLGITPTAGPDSPWPTPTPPADADEDGYSVMDGDCNDSDPTTYPGADEPSDGVDHNCDGVTAGDDSSATPAIDDADQDGFSISDGDCDDNDPTVYPGADEVDDGIDNDCDGHVDNSPTVDTPQTDADGDGTSVNEGDCDDTDPTVYPGADEIADGVDNDCDGLIDDFGVVVVGDVRVDNDGDGYTEAGGDCDDSDSSVHPTDSASVHSYLDCAPSQPTTPMVTTDQDGDGYSVQDGDCNDYSFTIYPGASEQCNGIDDDCDGEVDEDLPVGTYYADKDGDGYGTASVLQVTCSAAPLGFAYQDGDCNDADPAIHPGAHEACNGVDDDCNGKVDDPEAEGATVWYADKDGDGYGDAKVTTTACYPPQGYVADDSDCDDSDPDVYPGATETVDRKDNDCDGEVDE